MCMYALGTSDPHPVAREKSLPVKKKRGQKINLKLISRCLKICSHDLKRNIISRNIIEWNIVTQNIVSVHRISETDFIMKTR